MTNAEKYGFNPENLSNHDRTQKRREKHGGFWWAIPIAQTALAAVTLDGERWAFVFPPVLYQFVLSYLTIPANVP